MWLGWVLYCQVLVPPSVELKGTGAGVLKCLAGALWWFSKSESYNNVRRMLSMVYFHCKTIRNAANITANLLCEEINYLLNPGRTDFMIPKVMFYFFLISSIKTIVLGWEIKGKDFTLYLDLFYFFGICNFIFGILILIQVNCCIIYLNI